MDDQAWIQGIKQNEPDAMERLWNLVQSYARGTAYKKEFDRSRAEEIAEAAAFQAFLRIAKGVHQFTVGNNFTFFCKLIVVREVLRLLPRGGLDTQELDEETENAAAAEVDTAAVRTLLEPCLQELRPRARQVIELFYLRQLNCHEIAEQISITLRNVRAIRQRALHKLQACLKRRGFASPDDIL